MIQIFFSCFDKVFALGQRKNMSVSGYTKFNNMDGRLEDISTLLKLLYGDDRILDS